MTWNDCPLCGRQLYKAAHTIRCSDDHYVISLGFDNNEDHSIYAETAYFGEYSLYRNINIKDKWDLEKKNMYICQLELILSPKITKEYIEKLLVYL